MLQIDAARIFGRKMDLNAQRLTKSAGARARLLAETSCCGPRRCPSFLEKFRRIQRAAVAFPERNGAQGRQHGDQPSGKGDDSLCRKESDGGHALLQLQLENAKLLLQTARKLYGTTNEELMDNAKQFAYYPVSVLPGVDHFSNGTISRKFKTISGDSDRCSGILFNLKPNGDWLAIRYNDTENNVALWEFHNGIRRNVKFSDRSKPFMLDRNSWHELKLEVEGATLKARVDGTVALEYTLGSEPVAGRRGPPNADLYPTNNPVLRPPVSGRIGLWFKTDSTSYFKDYVVSREP